MTQVTQAPKSPYDFTHNWFGGDADSGGMVADIPKIWQNLFSKLKPTTFLEIGSFEGRSACFVIDEQAKISPISLVCVDTWGGSQEHDAISMGEVEARFDKNIATAIENAPQTVTFRKIKSPSVDATARLLTEGKKEFFDFIYVDGSHNAKDVLADLVMSFPLLRIGGIIVADDYFWDHGQQRYGDSLRNPKPGIDAFYNTYANQLLGLPGLPAYQCYMVKTSN
ncbi:class I SAM-dependent methyltransferase [Rhodospirillum sp. A1_3_36]|uniref:class I SAM-dependent methyltransferase n=1 Tax=Rhodospirillum sp. A1_3_36 TaxID=3391666 RepID=UPI0039A490F2